MIMDSRSVGEQTRLRCIYSGAFHGVIAWTIYAIVECWFASILPWIVNPYAFTPTHWGFTPMLLILYPVIGLILGGLFGTGLYLAAKGIEFLKKKQWDTLFPLMATLTVVFAFDTNLVIQLSITYPSVLLSLLVSILLIIALVFRAGSIIWYRRLRFLTNPWTTSITLLGLMWIIRDLPGYQSKAVKAGCALGYLIAIFLILFVIQRVAETLRISCSTTAYSTSPTKTLTFLVPVMFVVFGTSIFLKQAPLDEISNLKSSPLESDYHNIILITMDTVRADHLSLYGYERETTPNLKKFSNEATLYTRAIASGDMTLSTHASIFTGMYPRRHGAHRAPNAGYPWGRPLHESFHTLAEILSEKGYLTMAVVANRAYLNHSHRLDQGFQYYDQRRPIVLLDQTNGYYIRHCIRNVLTSFFSPVYFDPLYLRAEDINKEIFNVLDNIRKDERPFFVFINYMDAHEPWLPAPPFDTLYPGKDETFTTARYRFLLEEVLKLKRNLTEKEYNHMVSQYDGGIAYIDFHIGKLIAKLKKLRLYENTLIIVTSDHGEAFGERNLMEHGVSVYQDQVYIPLIIKYPNINEGRVIDELASSVDIMPTILDGLRHKIPEDNQGQSLLKLELKKSRFVISESFPSIDMIRWHQRFDRVERAIFSGPYKFISSTAGKRELYDLSKDPNEKEDLYNVENKIVRNLEVRLNQWLEMTVPEIESPTKVKLDKEALDRLKTLGYIQ